MSTHSGATTTQSAFPNKLEDIVLKLVLASDKEVTKIVLSPSFYEPWVYFRDFLPLMPNVPVNPQPNDKEAMTDLSCKIYSMMDSMSTSPYDRPNEATIRNLWSTQEFFECLLYQTCRNLACEGQTFALTFERKNLKNEAGRNKALNKIRGIIMLAVNLTVSYTSIRPSSIIRKIEEIQPATNPAYSPIREVRVKFQLENMDMNELRKTALDFERGGSNEKEWLVKLIMGRQGLVSKTAGGNEQKLKVEETGSPAVKRGGEEIENVGASKQARTA
jgi:hypothetical protein